MFRSLPRALIVPIVIFALALAAAPAADARPLKGSRPTLDVPGLFQAAIAWLQDLMGGRGEQPVRRSIAAAGDSLAQPNTGPCIDPMGGRPCPTS